MKLSYEYHLQLRPKMAQGYFLYISAINQHFLCERTHVTWRGKKFACHQHLAAHCVVENYRKVIRSTLDELANANCAALVELCVIDGLMLNYLSRYNIRWHEQENILHHSFSTINLKYLCDIAILNV